MTETEEKLQLWATRWLMEFGAAPISPSVYGGSAWFNSPEGQVVYDKDCVEYMRDHTGFGAREENPVRWGLGPPALDLIAKGDDS